jgi:hypothetical protein
VEKKEEIPVQKKKERAKALKILWRRKKIIPVEKKEEIHVQKKKDKGKGIKKPVEIDTSNSYAAGRGNHEKSC